MHLPTTLIIYICAPGNGLRRFNRLTSLEVNVNIRLSITGALALFAMSAVSDARGQDVRRLEEVVDSLAAKGFTGSVLVAKGDEVLLNKAWGQANLEWDIPNTPATRFRIASITKQFTAAAILLLEERGKLSVEDPVQKYLPDAPASWSTITIFHLLTHTSGLPDYAALPPYRSVGPLTPAEVVARFRDTPLDFVPGERWNYSNSGYALLGFLIEQVSGKSYAEFLRENIFMPLKMDDSGYDLSRDVILRRASGYRQTTAGTVNAPYLDMSLPYAAGGLYSTTGDLLTWTRALFGGRVLSAASLKKMTTPVPQSPNGYAFGLNVQSVQGRTVIFHAGGINGFTTTLAYYPDTHVTIAVLSNVADAPDVVAGLGPLVQ
jgi:CubicO group peptidase (beta-lactamase class C family)